MAMRYPIFVKRDLDGFFGLAIDNLVQLLLIVGFCGAFCGMTGPDARFITHYIMPGVAVSIVIGNLFYAAQAHWVARREKRSDVTALPYGINTPSLLVYVFFVMMPVYNRTQSAAAAWQMGLIACLGSGIIEFCGAFVAERIRRSTPRAALLSTLAGIAITFISMSFALQIWQRPLVAMVPLAVVLLVYFSHVRFPLGLPGGFVAVVLGTALAWLLPTVGISTDVTMSVEQVGEAWAERGRYLPQWTGPILWEMIRQEGGWITILPYISVIIPMGLFNVLGSLQNIESAEAGGDIFPTGPSLAVNGLGTIAAALFGSCFPTTIYIGHPGWKALGARAGYSTLNAIFVTAVCLTGTVQLISRIIPLEAGIAIVLWIGVVITAQAFQTSPLRHAPAAALGLFPAIAAWGATLVLGAFIEANRNPADGSYYATSPAAISVDAPAATQAAVNEPATAEARPPEPGNLVLRRGASTLQELIESEHAQLGLATQVNGFLVHGLNILERGYIFTCMIIAAIAAHLIDKRFYHAACWSLAAALLTLLGLMHAYQLVGNQIDYLLAFTSPAKDAFAWRGHSLVVGYLLMAGVFAMFGYLGREQPVSAEEARVVDRDEVRETNDQQR